MKDRNLFHLVNTIGNTFTRGCATRENYGVHSIKEISIFHRKKNILYIDLIACDAKRRQNVPNSKGKEKRCKF